MELLGIGLGMFVSLLWGSSDIIASVATRKLGTFKTTFLSQIAGFLALFSFGVIAYLFLRLPFTPTMVVFSMLIGCVTGICAALGYFYFYRALETGPIALVCPLTSTSPVFTLFLSILVMRQHITVWQIGFASIIILGILLASTNSNEIRLLFRLTRRPFYSNGVCCAIIAALAFSAMDVGLGTSATISGWFFPVLWTRIFSVCSLILISYWKRRKRMKWIQGATTAKLSAEESAHPATGMRDAQAMSSSIPFVNQGGRRIVDTEMTLMASSFRRQVPFSSIDPDATIILHPQRHHNKTYSMRNSPSASEYLEASLEETIPLRPLRSLSAKFTCVDDINEQSQIELSHLDTMPLSPQYTQEGGTLDHTEKTFSLSLPSLVDLSHLRKPLNSTLGLAVLLAIVAGVIENTATLGFSLDTLIATTGIASAITSGYSLIVILFGVVVYHERLTRNQIIGIALFTFGLVFLAFMT